MSSRLPRRLLSHAVGATLIATLVATAFAAPASAATSASTAEAMIIGWVNTSRTNAGLRPLRGDRDLAYIAGVRASRMASNNVMNHTIGGNLYNQLRYRDVQWYRYGEAVGWSGSSWTVDAARSLYRMWMASPSHRALLMSSRFNYIGLGLAYRSSNRRTFGSAVMTESLDHTGAKAGITAVRRSGDDVGWSWSGYDIRLQTHTAGLRDFDVQYRDRLGIVADAPRQHDLNVVRRCVIAPMASTTPSACERPTGVAMWARGPRQSRIWVP